MSSSKAHQKKEDRLWKNANLSLKIALMAMLMIAIMMIALILVLNKIDEIFILLLPVLIAAFSALLAQRLYRRNVIRSYRQLLRRLGKGADINQTSSATTTSGILHPKNEAPLDYSLPAKKLHSLL